jgi:hypothetical protein
VVGPWAVALVVRGGWGAAPARASVPPAPRGRRNRLVQTRRPAPPTPEPQERVAEVTTLCRVSLPTLSHTWLHVLSPKHRQDIIREMQP